MPQVITQEAVRATLEERLEEQLVFREAFRELDATNVNDDSMNVPQPEDVMSEPAAIEPGGEYPETREDYEKVTIERQKYGEMIKVPEEDIMDSVPDLIADHVDGAARKMAEFLDGLAFSELNSNVASASPVSDNADDNLVYDDIQEGITQLELNGAQPDMAFFGPRGKGDILKYLADRGTDLGDEAVTTGQFGAFAGLDFMYSTVGDITAHNAILIDSDRYGYEATFTPVETDEKEDFESDSQKYKVKTRKGFKAMKPEAAILAEG